MKITIVTLNGYFNYGNRLQLFALAKVLTKFGSEVNVYWPMSLKSAFKKTIKHHLPIAGKYEKEQKIWRFSRKYIPKNVNRPSENIVVGSDQVWNPNYIEEHPYLLNINSSGRVVSYAASLGVESLSAKEKELFLDALKRYDAISVRERTAKDLLQPLADKQIEVVLDPTLLLEKEEYLALEKCPPDVRFGEKYVLCYILGDNKNHDSVKAYAKRNNYRIITFSDKEDSKYGVEEFLYLIHHAELVCTDSFHACIFSFIFERPFVVFKRTGKANYMYTRLQNLMNTFGLKDREYNGKEITNRNLEIDYTKAKLILEKERRESLSFLKNALGVKDER